MDTRGYRCHIFFLSTLHLKQGIGSVYIMVDFICMGLLGIRGKQSKQELQIENYFPTAGFELTILGLEATTVTSAPRGHVLTNA